jgi:hypothetical protein
MASFVLLHQVQLALSLVLQFFLPAQHSSLEQFAFPLLICNQILYHVFSVNRNPNLMIFVSEFF